MPPAELPDSNDSHPKLYIPRPDVSDRQAFVVGLTVWGESFIDVFLKVGLPSILSPNNIPRAAEDFDLEMIIACLSGCHPQPLAVVFGHAHGHSPAWQSSVPTIAPRVPATFSRRRGLRRLPGEGSLERRVCLPPLSAEEYLPIIHLVFANLKTWLNGIHHGVSHQHLQAYLNEFTFRFNKRFYPFNAFRSLLGIAGDVTAPYLRRALLRSLAASYM